MIIAAWLLLGWRWQIGLLPVWSLRGASDVEGRGVSDVLHVRAPTFPFSAKLRRQPTFSPFRCVRNCLVAAVESGQIAAAEDLSLISVDEQSGNPRMCDVLSIGPAWCRIDSEPCRIEEHVLLQV
ncbi:hypothetical protein EMIT0158MI4_80003 [Burkholderia ambifaria]